MIAVISPAKTLDFETKVPHERTLPIFQKEALQLIDVLTDKTEEDVQDLMSISEKLATLNVERYHNFTKKKDPKRAKQAVFAFQGDVYQGLEAGEFNEKQVAFAQDHLRILSGLYGVLRPLDLIQPYRLEMGTQLNVNGSKNLYEFWNEKVAKQLKKDLKKQGDKVIINLASKEYFNAVDTKKLKAKIIDVDFKDYKNGEYKIISFYAKKARGLMSRYIIDNEIDDVNDLKGFDYEGYYYDDNGSTDTTLAFKRK